MGRSVCIILQLLLSSCVVTRVEFPDFGITCAVADKQAHEEVEAVRKRYEPGVKALMGSSRKPPRIYVVEDKLIRGVRGMTLASGIFLGSDAMQDLPSVVVHELAHWYLFDEGHSFPYFIQEGIAEHVTVAFGVAEIELVEIDDRSDLEELASLTTADVMRRLKEDAEQDEEDLAKVHELACTAYSLVRLVGFETLRTMHAEGRTSLEDVLAAAGL